VLDVRFVPLYLSSKQKEEDVTENFGSESTGEDNCRHQEQHGVQEQVVGDAIMVLNM
jgi:hypothetical protein